MSFWRISWIIFANASFFLSDVQLARSCDLWLSLFTASLLFLQMPTFLKWCATVQPAAFCFSCVLENWTKRPATLSGCLHTASPFSHSNSIVLWITVQVDVTSDWSHKFWIILCEIDWWPDSEEVSHAQLLSASSLSKDFIHSLEAHEMKHKNPSSWLTSIPWVWWQVTAVQ